VSNPKTYPVRMGCDNCGQITIYQIPRGFEVIDSDRAQDVYSGIERHNGEKHEGLYCTNCNTPWLRVFWARDDEVPVIQEAR